VGSEILRDLIGKRIMDAVTLAPNCWPMTWWMAA